MLTYLKIYNKEPRVVGPVVSDSIEEQVKGQNYCVYGTPWARVWKEIYSPIYTHTLFQINPPMLASLREAERAN